MLLANKESYLIFTLETSWITSHAYCPLNSRQKYDHTFRIKSNIYEYPSIYLYNIITNNIGDKARNQTYFSVCNDMTLQVMSFKNNSASAYLLLLSSSHCY